MVVTSTEFLQCDCLIMKAMCSCCVYFYLLRLYVFFSFVAARLHIDATITSSAVHQFECATGHCAFHKTVLFKIGFHVGPPIAYKIVSTKPPSTWTSLCKSRKVVFNQRFSQTAYWMPTMRAITSLWIKFAKSIPDSRHDKYCQCFRFARCCRHRFHR